MLNDFIYSWALTSPFGASLTRPLSPAQACTGGFLYSPGGTLLLCTNLTSPWQPPSRVPFLMELASGPYIEKPTSALTSHQTILVLQYISSSGSSLPILPATSRPLCSSSNHCENSPGKVICDLPPAFCLLATGPPVTWDSSKTAVLRSQPSWQELPMGVRPAASEQREVKGRQFGK